MSKPRAFWSARATAALMAAVPAMLVMAPTAAHAEFSLGLDIRIGYPPPPMPVYEQPPLPGPDYLWVPGHWAWSDWIDDYYWVDGYWEQPPEPDLLWTPAWWGWDNGAFRFHEGYWGREVGWYGGVDYGYGYHGHGWEGGRWEHGHLAYNRAAVNITNLNVTNVYYQKTTVINNYGPRVSYSGGAGGVQARPTPQEWRATQAPHIAPTPMQQQHVQQAATNPRNVAARVVPNWTPPPVHRVATDGTPVPRAVALAKGNAIAGAPPQFQRQAPGTAPGQFQARPGNFNGPPQPGNAPSGAATPYPRPAYNAAARPATGGQPGYAAPGTPPQPPRPAYNGAARPDTAMQPGTQPGMPPRPTWQNRAAPSYQPAPRPAPPGYGEAPRPAPMPNMVRPPAPQPPPQYHAAPVPNLYHPPAPQPQPQYHAPPPPAPRPAPPPPPPRPKPEHDHQK